MFVTPGLNGNDIPEQLPEELVPASARDLDQSVDFLKDILKNETRTRSPGNFDDPISKLPTRSFHSDTARGAGGRQDATVYKHNDDHTPPGGVYQPRSRHIDRDTVRTRSDDPTDDLSVMKRQLENSAKMLDRMTEENASRTREDDELDREMSDLRYRIKRLQDDLDYASRGPRSYAKDDEKRKLERELLHLMHEKLPDLEKRIEENQARKDKEKREQMRDRDRRNDRFGRFSDRDDEYSRRYDDGDRYRSSYGRDRSRERDHPQDDYDRRDYDRRDRDRDFDRSRGDDKDRDHRRPPLQDTRTPPPPPPPNPPSNSISQLPPAPPPPSSTPANMAKMTREERQAFIKAEAQRQIQERMKALGVTTSPSTPSIDNSVADRLAQEKKEAEEKARAAEKAEEERARARQERLANEKAIKEGKNLGPPSPVPVPAPPAPIVSSPVKPPAPPPPKTRARPPPPPTKPSRPTAPPAPIPSAPVISEPPPPPQPDPEEERIKRLEQESRKRREAMQARLRALEEEEEAARKAEAELEKRRQALSRTPIESPSTPAPPPPPPPPQLTQPVVQSPAPPVPVSPPIPEPPKSVPAEKPSFNPFSRIKKEESSTSAVPSPPVATGGGSTNPFFRSQTAPPPVAPAPPPSTSPAPRPYYNTVNDDPDDDWGEVVEKDEDDSSGDEFTSSLAKRTDLAEKFFGNILPSVRPQSAGPPTVESPRTPIPAPTTSDVAPPPPPPAPAPPTHASADNIPPPPGPPPPPPGPPPPAQTSTSLPQPTEDRGTLLSAIQGGARLRKATTNDRSASAISGKVIGDAAPPVPVNAVVNPPSPSPAPAPALDPRPEHSFSDSFDPPSMLSEDTKNGHRLSVDWYAGLAADHGASRAPTLSSMREEEEDAASVNAIPQPVFNVQDTDEHESADPMNDVDRSVGKCVEVVRRNKYLCLSEYRVRTLFPYDGQRPEDLCRCCPPSLRDSLLTQ